MRGIWLGGIAGGVGLVIACGTTDKKPPAANTGLDAGAVDGDIDGTTTSSSSGGSTSSSTSSSGNIGGPTQYDPNRVYLRGTTAEGSAEAECWVTDLDTHEVWLSLSTTYNTPVIRPSDKQILYVTIANTNRVLYQFVPDALKHDDTTNFWRLPAIPTSNDVPLASPGCTDPSSIMAWPDKSSWAYQCGGSGGTVYDSEAGALGKAADAGVDPGKSVVALGYGGHILRVSGAHYLIEDQNGAAVAFTQAEVASLSAGDRSVRARTNGFWVVGPAAGTNALTLFLLGFDGSVQAVGTYADPPADASANASKGAIDGDGALFVFGTRKSDIGVDIIVKRPLAPALSTIAYDESAAPKTANDFSSAGIPLIYPKIHISDLFTGP